MEFWYQQELTATTNRIKEEVVNPVNSLITLRQYVQNFDADADESTNETVDEYNLIDNIIEDTRLSLRLSDDDIKIIPGFINHPPVATSPCIEPNAFIVNTAANDTLSSGLYQNQTQFEQNYVYTTTSHYELAAGAAVHNDGPINVNVNSEIANDTLCSGLHENRTQFKQNYVYNSSHYELAAGAAVHDGGPINVNVKSETANNTLSSDNYQNHTKFEQNYVYKERHYELPVDAVYNGGSINVQGNSRTANDTLSFGHNQHRTQFQQNYVYNANQYELPVGAVYNGGPINVQGNSETDYPRTQRKNINRQTRKTYNPEQVAEMEELYSSKKYIRRHERILLATSLGIKEKDVKIWFQNRRAKDRKSQ